MKFLVDTSARRLREMLESPQGKALIAGQLLTPLTGYRNWEGVCAGDNGAYSGLDRRKFLRFCKRQESFIDLFRFLAMPDCVGNARRTNELYRYFIELPELQPWRHKWAYVAQDGLEDMDINWSSINALFIGGTNEFKDSASAYDICKTAKAMNVYTHVGRVNQWKRYKQFMDLGCDSCDGSGVSKYDDKLIKIYYELTGKTPVKRGGVGGFPIQWELV